jgi:hypothetical protein
MVHHTAEAVAYLPATCASRHRHPSRPQGYPMDEPPAIRTIESRESRESRQDRLSFLPGLA